MENLGRVTSLNLSRGGLFSKIRKLTNGNNAIRADTVVARIRGTEFFVAYGRSFEDKPDIWLCVNEGQGVNILYGEEMTDPYNHFL